MALADGRALPASVLAAEAGVSAPAMSSHLGKLLSAGLVTAERSGRNRYYRLADHQVMDALEAMARLAPTTPVTSLRQGTRAAALRRARTCYDHLAGRLGVDITEGLLASGALVAKDGRADIDRRAGQHISAVVPRGQEPFELGPKAGPVLERIGVCLDDVRERDSRRPLLRFCLDWTEQRYHLAGLLGAEVCSALTGQGWLQRMPRQRAVRLTPAGRGALTTALGTIRDDAWRG